MMPAKVLNLIQKFEKLSNEIACPKLPVIQQRHKPAAMLTRVEEPSTSPFVEVTPTQSQPGWNHRPLWAIEEGVRGIARKIDEVIASDERAVFGMFVEMLDLLIQLNSVDTDGLKSMKIKKECCVADLKKAKQRLTELSEANFIETCKETEPSESELTPVMSTITLRANQCVEDGPGPGDDYDTNNDLPVLHSASKNLTNDELHVNAGVVHSLRKMFEVEHKKEIQSTDIKPSPTFVQTTETMENNTDRDENLDTEEACVPSAVISCGQISSPDIHSEIEYYQEIVPSLDREDSIKIESVEERLENLLVLAEKYPEAKGKIEILLRHVKAFKRDESFVAEIGDVEMNMEGITFCENQQKTCEDFLQAEKACIWLPEQNTPDMAIEEPIDSNVSQEEAANNEPEANQSSVSTIQVVDIKIPGDDHLTESMIMISTYKEKLEEYLAGTRENLLQNMTAIEANLQVIANFNPHPNLDLQFAELRNSYQEIFDFITESKFAEIFNETIKDKNGKDNNSHKTIDAINTFHNLCAEVRNYYPFIEKLDTKETAQVEMLIENMVDLFDEIERSDMDFDPELQCKKHDTLKEIRGMLQRLNRQQ